MFKRKLLANALVLALASSSLLVVGDTEDSRKATHNGQAPSTRPPILASTASPGDAGVSEIARTQAAALITEATTIIDQYQGSHEPVKRALANLDAALQLDPADSRIYIQFARVGLMLNGLTPAALQRAEVNLRKAIDVDPKGGDAHLLLGYILAHSDRKAESDAAFSTARGLPHNEGWMVAMTAELTGTQRAKDEFAAQSREFERSGKEAIAKAVAAAGGNARAAAERLGDEAAKLLDEAGTSARRVIGPASEKLQQAMAIDAKVPRVHVELARLAMKAGGLSNQTLDLAERSLRIAIEIDPQFGDAYVLLGYVLNHAGRLDEATQAFARAERTPHTSAWLESNMAELKRKQGREQEAIEIFARIAADPNKPVGLRASSFSEIQKYYALTDARDIADRAYRQHIELTPDALGPRINYGNFLRVYRTDLARSEKYLRDALKVAKIEVARSALAMTLYMKWAEAWIKDPKSAQAAAIFDEARALDSDLKLIVDDLGKLQQPHPIMDALVAKGISIDVSSTGPGGTTPLSSAARSGSMEVVRQMIRLGAHPNTPGYNGFTGLMAAASAGNVAMVKLFLDSGADPGLRTAAGKDAAAYARERGDIPLATLLEGAKRTFVATAASLPPTPFKVGFTYRVRKEWVLDQSIPETRFHAGEQVIFDYPQEYGDLNLARFYFRGPKSGMFRQFVLDKKQIATWREYFEEVGPAPLSMR